MFLKRRSIMSSLFNKHIVSIPLTSIITVSSFQSVPLYQPQAEASATGNTFID